jgi:transposase-like protein
MKSERNGFSLDRDAQRVRWIKRYRASGMGLKQFARRHGLKAGRLHYWVYQQAKPVEARERVPGFQEVRLPIPASSAGSWSAEVSLANGTTVRLAREADVAWVKSLIDCLRGPCSH